MQAAIDRFKQTFSHWDIQIPQADVDQRHRGRINQKGWAIWYLFGVDDRGEYLDYYAAHRMTDDDHVRIYANGTQEALPVIQSLRRSSDDPSEEQRLEAEFFAENQRVAAMLEAKGFGLDGSEPPLVAINRVLHVKPDAGG